MESISRRVDETLKRSEVSTRPGASCGFWIAVLLPIVVYSVKEQLPESREIFGIRFSSITCTTLFAASVVYICYLYSTTKTINELSWIHYLPSVLVASVLYLFLRLNILAFFIIGTLNSFFYSVGLGYVFEKFPLSFTFGEASIFVQAVIMFIVKALRNVFFVNQLPNLTDLQKITLILQVGLLGCGLIIFIVYLSPVSKRFVGLVLAILIVPFGFVVPLLNNLLGENPILWIVWLIFSDAKTVVLLLYWFGCCVLAVLAIGSQVAKDTVASTVVRKNFHYLIVAVYIPGIIFNCTFLYLSSGVTLAVFILVEMVRVLQIPPFGDILQRSFQSFADEKDQGVLALTPIYLLAGCSFPLWINPDYCSLGPERYLPTLAGILSVGIGDTAASVGGTIFGKHKWNGSVKTKEGTLISIISQYFVIMGFIIFGHIPTSPLFLFRAMISVIVTSLVEAKTDQVDNLVLPLVQFLLGP